MAVSLARLLRDGETVFHGVASPLPMVAILLAKAMQAPDLVYLNITGSIDPSPLELPISTVDPQLLHGTRGMVTLTDLFDLDGEREIGHIRLSREASLLVVAPATALGGDPGPRGWRAPERGWIGMVLEPSRGPGHSRSASSCWCWR